MVDYGRVRDMEEKGIYRHRDRDELPPEWMRPCYFNMEYRRWVPLKWDERQEIWRCPIEMAVEDLRKPRRKKR